MLELDEGLRSLKEDLKQRRLIVFVGSGISIDSGLPGWEGFLKNFIAFCRDLNYPGLNLNEYFDDGLFQDALRQSARYPTQVATVLKNKLDQLPHTTRSNAELDFKNWFWRQFADKKPNTKHELITQTEYPYILTSNYDTLLEEAAKALGTPYGSISFTQEAQIAESVYMDDPAIIHVHGTYQDVAFDRVIFTAEDYKNIVKKGYKGFSFAIQALFLKHSTLFVGYGASDPHLEDLAEEFAAYFGYSNSNNMSKNYLVVLRDKVGAILDNYKKIMRTELIVIDELDDYNHLLSELRSFRPRQLNIGL